ncbi:hypothetical protein ID866_1078 [Astraeus odoratus]|nr:hypothetical protein ID866_1078 [Astraeus odoratus]
MTRKRSRLTMSSLVPALGAGVSASALFAVRVSSPAVVFLAALSILFTKPLSPPSPSPITPVVVQSRVPRRTLIFTLLSLSALSFLIDGLAYVAYAVLNKVWGIGNGVPLASILGLIAYTGLAALGAWKDINNVPVWSFGRVRLSIAIALALDITQVVLLASSIKTRDPAHLCDNTKLSKCIPETFHILTPLLRALLLFPLLFALYSPRIVYTHVETQPDTEANDSESAPLQEDGPSGESSKYGTFTGQGQCDSGPPPVSPGTKGTPVKCQSCCATLRRLVPYIYPVKSRRFKFVVAFAALLHTITRALKPLLPLSLGATVNAFLSQPSTITYPIPMPLGNSPYPYISVFLALYFLTSQGGIPALVLALGSCFGEYADTALESTYAGHLLGLSLGQNGNVKGTSYPTGAVSKALEAVAISTAAVLDSFIGVVVLGSLFGWEVGLGVFVVLNLYVYATRILARTLSVATVPYASSRAYPALALLTLVQAVIASGGLLLGSLYIAHGVVGGEWSVGAWVAWVWYWGALILSLSAVPCLYKALVDVRTVLDVLKQPMEVPSSGKDSLDGEGAVEIRFENVSFTYPYCDEHAQRYSPLFSSLSFTVPASSTVALVGAPGSGKSTILKLLYRLYLPDNNSGSIYIDGKDIRDLSLLSLREKLVVVAKAGAEERRAAISRALAKGARAVLVEGDLDADVVTLVNNSRTVLWEVDNAHLASVQEGVDQIIVLKDGQISEHGTFKELLEANGVFASMWTERMSPPDVSAPSAAGYDVEAAGAQAVSGSGAVADSPHAITASLRPADSVRTPSIRAPTASVRAESIAPAVPAKDADATGPISFPTSEPEDAPAPAPVAFPTSDEGSPPAPIAFPTSDDTRSVSSQPRHPIPGHVQSNSVTFDTTSTPPRSDTPDPSGTPNAESTDGKRKRISSQNFQRIARRISLSTQRKGANIPAIANIANVLRRESSTKDKSESKSGEPAVKDADAASGTGSGSGVASGGNSARNSGEVSRQAEKDKEREEKKKKRKSFMGIGSSGST